MSKEEGEEEAKPKSIFEHSGSTKIYVATDSIRYCSLRKIIQIGCLNSRTEEQIHLVSSPGVLHQYCSKNFLQYLKWRDIKSDVIWYLKESGEKQAAVDHIFTHFFNFLNKEVEANNSVTLVFYSIAEYHELMLIIKEDADILEEFMKIVSNVIIYQHYKTKASDKHRDLQPIDELLHVKVRIYSCDKLAELLRQLFVESNKTEEKYHPFKPDPNKLIKIKVSYPRILWSSQPKYIQISSLRTSHAGKDWREDSNPLPREEYRFLPCFQKDVSDNNVSAFRTGFFRCNQPVIVKFKDLQENTRSIDYKGDLLNCYKAEGSCPLYTYNNVYFAITVFSYQNDFKDCTDLNDSDYMQYKGYVDNEIDIYCRILEPDIPVLQFKEKPDIDISVKDDNRKFDVAVADILDRKNNVAIRRGMLKSILVRLETNPSGSVFMISSTNSKFKGLKIVNHIFCAVCNDSSVARLVLTSSEDDVNLKSGNIIGQAVPINQSNFSEALIQAFVHEMDVTNYILEPIKKRRMEDEEQKRAERLAVKKKSEFKQQDLKRPRNDRSMEQPAASQMGNDQLYLGDIGFRRSHLDQSGVGGGQDLWQQQQQQQQKEEYHNQQYIEFLENIGERRY